MKRTLPRAPLLLFLFLLLAAFAAPRVMMLDADMPAWTDYNYQPLDEVFYSLRAVRAWFETDGTSAALSALPREADTMLWLQNASTAASMALSGNTLAGLRLPALAWSLLTLLLLLDIARHAMREAGVARLRAAVAAVAGVACLAVSALEPSLILLGVVNETTGLRTLGAAFALWLALRASDAPLRRGWLLACGAAAGASVFLIYPSNLFVLLFVALALPVPAETHRQWLRLALVSRLWMLAGFAAVGGLIGLHKLWLLREGAVTMPLGDYLDRVHIVDVLYNVAVLDLAGAWRHNAALLVASVTAMAFAWIEILRGRASRVTFLAGLLVGSFALQCLFLNDYPTRKLNVIVPFIVLLTFSSLLPGTTVPDERWHRRGAVLALALVAAVAIGFAAPYESAFLEHATPWRGWILLLVLALLGSQSLGRYAGAGPMLFAAVLCTAAWTSALNGSALLAGRTYHYRNGMAQLAAMLPADAYVAGWGSYALAFGGGRFEPFGNMYFWSSHPRGRELRDRAFDALASTGRPLYWVGDDPATEALPGAWERVGSLQPSPLEATFEPIRRNALDVHRRLR